MKKVLEKVKERRMLLIGIMVGIIIFGGGVYAEVKGEVSANNVSYSNASSGINAEEVQTAVDRLYEKASTTTEKCPEGYVCIEKLSKVVKLGDYVKMTPTLTDYSELNLWRVININSNGTIDLVSEYVSSTQKDYMGINAYLSYISSLNNFSKNYANSKYTYSTRCIGYSNQTEIITDTSYLNANHLSIPYQDAESKGFGDTGYETDYNLIKKAIGTLSANVVGTTIVGDYWFASRSYYTSGGSNPLYNFCGRYINTTGTIATNMICYRAQIQSSSGFTTGGVAPKHYFRPIVTLKSDVVPSDGSGTSSSPYVLS